MSSDKKFINMDRFNDDTGRWWVDYLDLSKEHPEHVRKEFASHDEALVLYHELVQTITE